MSRIKKTNRLCGNIHLDRLTRHVAGASPEQIAEEDGVTVGIVVQSINTGKAMQQSYELDSLNRAAGQILTENFQERKAALRNVLTARKKLKDPEKNKFVVVPDLDMQAKGLEIANTMHENLQPRGGKGVSVNVGMGVNVNQPGHTQAVGGRIRSFEDILRAAEERPQLTAAPDQPELPASEEKVIEATP